MKNPDREELVKLADLLDQAISYYLENLHTPNRETACRVVEQILWDDKQTIVFALRRLASSEGAGIREAFVRVLASLAAAISILERTPKAKKAVASDKMFDTMLDDYRKALEAGRAALTAPGATTKSDGGLTPNATTIAAIEELERGGGEVIGGPSPIPFNGYSDYTPVTVRGSTSDPSSTRSEVTALASLQGEDAVERVALRHDLLVIARESGGKEFGPNTWNISFTDETWQAFTNAILATGLVPDEAAVRADSTANLISIIADIREKTGLGGKPMLNELADAIAAEIDQRLADEREKCAKVAEAEYADKNWHMMYRHAADVIAAAIRSGGGE